MLKYCMYVGVRMDCKQPLILFKDSGGAQKELGMWSDPHTEKGL